MSTTRAEKENWEIDKKKKKKKRKKKKGRRKPVQGQKSSPFMSD